MTNKAHHAIVSLFALTVAAVALGATPALAYRGHVFGHTFDGKTPGNGEFEKFEQPAGVAVNEATGNVYVVDVGKSRVEWFNSTGSAFEGSFNGGATPAKAFLEPEGIAVDNTCRLREERTGEALSESACEKLDPSNGDVYVVDSGHAVVDKFDAGGEYLSQLTGTCEKQGESPPCPGSRFIPFKELDGVAVDATGELWVAASDFGAEGKVYSFNDHPANKFEKATDIGEEAGALERPGFAVDSRDDLYASFENAVEGEDFVAELDGEGAVLNARVDVESFQARVAGAPLPGSAVELTSNDVYVDNMTAVARFASDGVPVEGFGEGHLTGGGGVAVNSSSGQVYAVDSPADVVAEFTLEPPGAPEILGESASNVTSDGASLGAEVDPHGASTSYHFQYGRCPSLQACAGSGYEQSVPMPEGAAGSDFEIRDLDARASGLVAGSAYHYRVVAENEIAGEAQTVDGAEETFATQAAGGELVLPDAREWELVSPPDKHGALISSLGLIQAAAAGDAISYPASGPTEGESQGVTNGVQVLSARGESGWSSHDLTVAQEGPTGYSEGRGGEYRLFSQDLSLAVVQPFGSFTPLSSEASEQTAYLREDASGRYAPLVSEANVPAGTVFGGEVGGECAEAGQIACGPKFRGATPDLSHIILSSPIALSEGAPAGENLYEWAGGRLELIGQVEEEPQLAFHAVSDDGSRVIFSGVSEGREGLLMRDTTTGETAQLDAAEPACVAEGDCAGGGAEYRAAAGDGSRVFFTDEHRLTKDSGGTINSAEEDLYVCEMTIAPEKLGCGLRDLTPVQAGGKQAGVVGVLGASEDGSYVYFAANGVLTSEANGEGERAVQGSCEIGKVAHPQAQCNLYVMHHSGAGWEAPRFIAVLSGQDRPDWSPSLERHTARSSPDGDWLAFMSQRSLTGYDNEDVTSAKPGERLDEEVYLYHVASGVVCASCDPTQERPAGVPYGNIDRAHGGLAGGESVWPASAWIAASTPGWESYESGASLYQPRFLSDGGRLFFDSSDHLVPQDVNGTENVYEYEPLGFENKEDTPECTRASATFGERAGGCVDLISSGSSSDESVFLDASEDGSDVFFLTSAKLAPQDTDTAFDVYDAHECTSASPCFASPIAQPPQCVTEASCRPSPIPQPSLFGAPSSATFAGAGNVAPSPESAVLGVVEEQKPKPPTRAQELSVALKACHKDRSKTKRKRCEENAREKYGANAKKSNGKRT